MTSVLFKKEYVTQDLYIILYIDLEGNEAQRNWLNFATTVFIGFLSQ